MWISLVNASSISRTNRPVTTQRLQLQPHLRMAATLALSIEYSFPNTKLENCTFALQVNPTDSIYSVKLDVFAQLHHVALGADLRLGTANAATADWELTLQAKGAAASSASTSYGSGSGGGDGFTAVDAGGSAGDRRDRGRAEARAAGGLPAGLHGEAESGAVGDVQRLHIASTKSRVFRISVLLFSLAKRTQRHGAADSRRKSQGSFSSVRRCPSRRRLRHPWLVNATARCAHQRRHARRSVVRPAADGSLDPRRRRQLVLDEHATGGRDLPRRPLVQHRLREQRRDQQPAGSSMPT